MFLPNIFYDNCETRLQYIFIAAVNQTVDAVTQDYYQAVNEYASSLKAYDDNIRDNQVYISYFRHELDP